MTKTQREEANANLTLLPERCYAILPGRPKMIEIRRGHPGYWPCTLVAANVRDEAGQAVEFVGTPEELAAIRDEFNDLLGVTPAQREAMLIGSMFGYDVPGANVEETARIMGTRQ